MVKNKMEWTIKSWDDSWDDTTKTIIRLEIGFIEKNQEKLSLCTNRSERGVWVVFIKPEDNDDVFAKIKKRKLDVFFKESIGKEGAFPCVFNTIESIDRKNLPQDIYKMIETYNPDTEFLVMFYLGEGPNNQQCYRVPRKDVL